MTLYCLNDKNLPPWMPPIVEGEIYEAIGEDGPRYILFRTKYMEHQYDKNRFVLLDPQEDELMDHYITQLTATN